MLFEDGEKKRRTGPTLIGFNESQSDHRNTACPTHPESSSRVDRIKELLEQTGLLQKCTVLTKFLETDDGDLKATHQREMVDEILSAEKLSQAEINSLCGKYDSVFMTKNSIKAAKEAVACVRELTHQIMKNKAQNGFAAVRPPGHHADAKEPCGFCLFNNTAQAVEEAFNCGADRILIVDLDVHHGQGTQRIFYEDKRVLYFSIHRHEHGLFWPHLRESDFDHIGSGDAVGYNANLPLNETGCGDSDYLSILFQVLLPLATQFDPHFVIVSAGFDSLQGDPVGKMSLTPDGYSHFIYQLKALAQGRMLVVLEGGYNHQMSAVAVQKCVKVLLGHAPSLVSLSAPPKESTVSSCVSLVSVLRHKWNCFDYFPSRTTMRLADWPVINSTVEYKYDPSKRPADTGEILQKQLETAIVSEENPTDAFETLIFFNEGDSEHACLEEGDGHPENPRRTRKIMKALRDSEAVQGSVERKCDRSATDDEILTVHTRKMLDYLKTTELMDDAQLFSECDDDFNSIYLTRSTLKVARNAAGTAKNP
ncbi:unnamed protein product [Caenorhabditis sp. 36 PRJEB53466]|nr:unnamed protein product [Caenorhabditis sp. 36 PRJEB53466]